MEAHALDAVLGGLTAAQRAAARATGPVLVLAGAGSGKTRSLIAGVACRIVERRIPPGRILAVTFTNKAAGEMRDRIRGQLGVDAPAWLGTFHALGARMLRTEPEVAALRAGFDILDADDTKRILKRLLAGIDAKSEHPDAKDRKRLKLLGDRLSRMKDALITPAAAADHVEEAIAARKAAHRAVDEVGLRLAVRIYRAYQAELRDMNAADFGDLLMWPALTMQRDDSYRRRWASRFDCILADEFQDVNRAQSTWLHELARDHQEIFAVGDDSQSIYSWRGAEIGFIRTFGRTYPATSLFKLEENFRSTAHILGAATAVIAHDVSRLPKTLFTRLGDGEPVEILSFGDPDEEAIAIAQEIGRRVAEGANWEDIAILYRANRLSRVIEEALLKARIPYCLVGDTGFYERAAVKDALALLRLSESPASRQSDEAFRRVCNKPTRGVGAKTLGEIELEAGWRDISLMEAVAHTDLPRPAAAGLRAFGEAIHRAGPDTGLSVAERLALLLDVTGYLPTLRAGADDDAETAIENLAELQLLAEGFRSVEQLLEHTALASGPPREDLTGRVQLMTLHRAKGLEFPHVFLPAWDSGVFPSGSAEDIDEERRLAYVALTRGMRRVAVSSVRFRDGRPSAPSVFVDQIPEEHRCRGWLRFLRPDAAHRRAPARDALARDQLQALGML